MRNKLRKLLRLLLALSMMMNLLIVPVWATEQEDDGMATSLSELPDYQPKDVYVWNYSGDIPGYTAFSNKSRLYDSPYRTDIWVNDCNIENDPVTGEPVRVWGEANWNFCTASVLNMIDTTRIDPDVEADVPYATIPVYCVDGVTGAKVGCTYRRCNLEESGYFDTVTAGRIRAIFMNSFPMMDMEDLTAAVNAWIEGGCEGLNRSEKGGTDLILTEVKNLNKYEVISATQAVIWTITNSGRLANDVLASYSNGYVAKDLDRIAESIYYGYDVEGNAEAVTVTADTHNNINTVARYLEALAPMPATNPLVTPESFQNVAITYMDNENGTYTVFVHAEITVDFENTTDPNGNKPELTLTVVCDGKSAVTRTITDGLNKFDLVIEGLSQVPEVSLAIDGMQGGNDVYLYVPADGRFASQCMAGYEAGVMPIHTEDGKPKQPEEGVSVSVKKEWQDAENQDGIRPDSVTVHLLANGSDTGKTAVLNAENNWAYTWNGLTKKDSTGADIVYTVKEDAVDGYIASVGGDAKGGYTITNTHVPAVTSVFGSKTWIDNEDQDGIRPESIVIHLFADGTQMDSKTVSAADNWTWKFENLPVNKNGQKVIYTVTEDPVEGYSGEVKNFDEVKGFEVMNTHVPSVTTIKVSKVWDDCEDQDGVRPNEITVKLWADGVEVETQTLNEENRWQHIWNDLPEYANGAKIQYSVTEAEVDGYTAKVDGEAGDVDFTITNCHIPEQTQVSVIKVWDDQNNAGGKRPERIVVNLLADGQRVVSAMLSESNGWQHTFEELPKNAGGVEIQYTVTEEVVPGYDTEITGSAVEGYTVTNKKKTEPTPEKPKSEEQKPTEAPMTGDMITLWLNAGAVSGLSLLGAGVASIREKRRKK